MQGETIARLRDLKTSQQDTCPTRFNQAFTSWRVAPFSYRAAPGQGVPVTLTSLISEHYGGASRATADHVERFYFTRELGGTRWERWQNANSNGASFALSYIVSYALLFSAFVTSGYLMAERAFLVERCAPTIPLNQQPNVHWRFLGARDALTNVGTKENARMRWLLKASKTLALKVWAQSKVLTAAKWIGLAAALVAAVGTLYVFRARPVFPGWSRIAPRGVTSTGS